VHDRDTDRRTLQLVPQRLGEAADGEFAGGVGGLPRRGNDAEYADTLTNCEALSRRSKGRKARVIRTTPPKLIASSHSKSAGETCSKVPPNATPALFTTTLTRPCSASTASGNAATASLSATSSRCSLTLRPGVHSRAATSRKPAVFTSAKARPQPRAASTSASAAPMPLAAPVMTATPPANGSFAARLKPAMCAPSLSPDRLA